MIIRKRLLTMAMWLSATYCCLLPAKVQANAVAISGTSVTGGNITFSLTWENSWRLGTTPYNWDAVWLFVKYADCSGGVQVWQHALLNPSSAAHTTTLPAKLEILTSVDPSDGNCRGVFVRRASTNLGGPGDVANAPSASVAAASITLAMNIAAGTYNFRVFGIEMVYTPAADFQIGDGLGNVVPFANYTNTFPSFTARTVIAADEYFNSNIAAGALYAGSPAVPAAYPVGWDAFYCMKYEISQEEWVDFLNTLTYDQQASRTIVAPNTASPAYAMAAAGANRNGIRISAAGDATTAPKTPAIYACDLDGNASWNGNFDGQNVAANWLSWADLTAFLDWACLRPMSEMEYEKECRGIAARTNLERPWGSSGYSNGNGFYGYRYCCGISNTSSYTASNGAGGGDGAWNTLKAATSAALTAGTTGRWDETSTSTGNGLCAIGNTGNTATDGPLRVGFAAGAATTRITAGSSYYGVMDLAGNVWEHTVSTDATGITFSSDALGNGILTAAGDADVATWPAPATATGSGFRGGAWNTLNDAYAPSNVACNCAWYFAFFSFTYACTSNRAVATTVNTTRTSSYGGRGVRKP